MNAADESVRTVDSDDSKIRATMQDAASAVRAAALKLQSQHVWPVFVSNLAISAIVVFVLWPLADRAILLIWAALIWGLALVRFFGWRRCPVDDLDHDAIARGWGRFAVAVSSLAGVLWGGMPLLFFTAGLTPPQLLLILITAGMAAGHAAAQSAYIRAFFAYIIPGALPLGIFYIAQASQIEVFIGVLVLLFAGSITNIALTHNREFAELVRLRLEISKARDAAEAGSRAKNEFLSVISHELRTPLTSIRGALELLEINGNDPSYDRAKLVEMALNNTDRLTKMIDDLLDIEKMEAGKMTFDLRPLHVLPLITDVVSANTSYAERFGVSLDVVGAVDDELMILGEHDRLIQHDISINRGVGFISGLQKSVRPVITYAFFLLFATIEITLLMEALNKGTDFAEAINVLWDDDVKAIFAAIVSFWFGSRAIDKARKV